METKVDLAAGMADYLQSLDEPRKRLLFACLDCLRAPPSDNGLLLPSILDVSAFVLAQTRSVDKDTIAQTLAALETTCKPAMLPAPPLGLAGSAPLGHRVSAVRAQKDDCPLRGTPLLDGQALSWGDRLKEMAIGVNGGTNTLPLIRNYAQACQVYAEYASLEFKAVPDNNAADFPVDEAQQRALVALIYEAIIDMGDILERKRPTSLKKANTSGTTCSAAGDSDILTTQTQTQSAPAEAPPKPVKDTISVSKVKGLSRIEVWLLSWTILVSTHDIHRGRLPFLPWSKTDWGWDGTFGTFRQRLDAVVATLRRSKAAVCSLLESDYKSRLESHPMREYRRKENNRAQNAERNAQVFVGRHTLVTRKMTRSADGDLCDHEGNIVAPGDASHSDLIEQTIALSQMGARGQKAKRASPEHDGDGQPKPKRAQAARRRTKKTASEQPLENNSQSTSPAVAAPLAIMPKPATAIPDASPAMAPPPTDMHRLLDAATDDSRSDTKQPAEALSPSDILAPVPSIECAPDVDVGIKSGDEADEWALAAPAQLLTPSPELARLSGFPPVRSSPAPPFPDTAGLLPENEVPSQADLTALFGPSDDTLDGLHGLNGISYAPAGYLGPLDSLYHPYHDAYALYDAGMDTVHSISAFDAQIQQASSWDAGMTYAGDAAMEDVYHGNSSLLPLDGAAEHDINSAMLMSMTLSHGWFSDVTEP